MNAASYLYVCQHNTDDDARYMAKKLGVNINQIPRKPLAFSLWSPSKGLLSQGNVTFKNNTPRFSNATAMNRLNRSLKIIDA